MDPYTQHPATPTSQELAGDAAPFAAAVGSAESLAALADLAAFVGIPRPSSIHGLRTFLGRYRDQWLAGIELPAIRDAYHHACRGEVRELIDLDRRLAARLGKTGLANASRHTGRQQLRRLRPLRHRTLQRYLRAVEAGEATGWHLVVFGILLALFSLPLRQGLAHYAIKTQEGLLDSAATGLALAHADREMLKEDCAAPVAPLLQRILPPSPLVAA